MDGAVSENTSSGNSVGSAPRDRQESSEYTEDGTNGCQCVEGEERFDVAGLL